MSTISEDNDIYNGGGGGAVETGTFLEGDGTSENPLDVKPLPTETSGELNYALMDCLSMVKVAGTGINSKPRLLWAKFPIVVQTNARDFSPYDNNYRTAALVWDSTSNPLVLSDSSPMVINDWQYHQSLQHTAEINMKLGYYDAVKSFHSGRRSYTLFKTSFIQDYANDGKFLKCVRTGSYMELEWETLESHIFEVYIDEDDASNNRNVIYNDIVSALSAGKLVYLKVLDSSLNIYAYAFSYHDVGNKELHFTLIEVFGGCTVVDYVIKDDNSYSYEKIDPLDLSCGLDESFTPPVKYNFTFSTLKQWYNSGFSLSPQIYLKYKNANGDYYKLRAVKLTATEIMFSVYDPDTARNLSIVLNDQNQYTVIT